MTNFSLKEAIKETQELVEAGQVERAVVSDLLAILEEKEAAREEARFCSCGLCHGVGYFRDYGDESLCGCCFGIGGSYS